MAETTQNPTMQERTKELTDRLESGMQELFQSDKYKEYLKSMSHFHNYSSRNIALIHLQMPGASRVGSYKLWDEKFNRHVKKGEKGIRIFAPIAKTEKREFEKLDPETKAPLLDEDGKPIMETLQSDTLRFKLVPVFDISQTQGEPLPELVENLTGNVEHYEAFLEGLKATSPLPIEFEKMDEDKDGYCRYGEKIGIREGMSEAQTITAIVHEMTHARLHNLPDVKPDVVQNTTDKEPVKPRYVKEIEAESVAYVVCQHYGIETAPNSFGYLAEWGGKDMKGFKASLDVIRKEASSMINTIGGHFKAICAEKGIDLTAAKEETAQTAEPLAQTAQASDTPQYTTEERTENIAGLDFTVQEVVPQEPVSVQKQQEAAKTAPNMTADDEILPDYEVTREDRNDFGYTTFDMLPLSRERALELFETQIVYLLYEDDSEGMALSSEEIAQHKGMFGIEPDVWMASAEYSALKKAQAEAEAVKETAFLDAEVDSFAIYQVKDGADMRDIRFEDMASLEKQNNAVERGNYDLIHTATLAENDTLDSIFYQYNEEIPKGFEGHSLSVSDVVVLKQAGEFTSHFVDKFGFATLPEFLGVEKEIVPNIVQESPVQAVSEAPTPSQEKPETMAESVPAKPETPIEPEPPQEIKPPIVADKVCDIPPYRRTHDYALEHGEYELYRQDKQLNMDCAAFIDKAVQDSNYKEFHYDLKAAAKAAIAEYGGSRVRWVLANTMQRQHYDGRYSASNIKWASNFRIEEKGSGCYCHTHPYILNGFIDRVRELEKVKEKPSILAAISDYSEKARKMQNEPKPENKKEKGAEL